MRRIALALSALLLIGGIANATAVTVYGKTSTGIDVPILATASGSNYLLNVTGSFTVTGSVDSWSAGTTITAGQTTVTGGSATQIAAASATRRAITVRNDNTGTINVYLGPSGVTTSTGFTLVPGTAVTLSLSAGAALFAIQASGSPVVSWLAESS